MQTYIYVIVFQTQVLSLCLTDTSDPSVDIHINDILATEGHARFLPDDEVPEHVTKDQHKDVNLTLYIFVYALWVLVFSSLTTLNNQLTSCPLSTIVVQVSGF